jgi:D-aminoacyl-tRNA deacylase
VAGEIANGLLVLVAVGRDDTPATAAAMAEKVVHLRIFNDENDKMNRSLVDTGGSILAVSQFTLYGDARGQRRPSFIAAAPPEKGKALYEEFLAALDARSGKTRREFGALAQGGRSAQRRSTRFASTRHHRFALRAIARRGATQSLSRRPDRHSKESVSGKDRREEEGSLTISASRANITTDTRPSHRSLHEKSK